MSVNTKFRVFSEIGTNVLTDNNYDSNEERKNGCQPNTQIRSQLINTSLKESSLISCAIVDLLSNNANLGINSTKAQIQTAIEAGLKNFIANNNSKNAQNVIPFGTQVLNGNMFYQANGSTNILNIGNLGDFLVVSEELDSLGEKILIPSWISPNNLKINEANNAKLATKAKYLDTINIDEVLTGLVDGTQIYIKLPESLYNSMNDKTYKFSFDLYPYDSNAITLMNNLTNLNSVTIVNTNPAGESGKYILIAVNSQLTFTNVNFIVKSNYVYNSSTTSTIKYNILLHSEKVFGNY